MFAYFGAKHGAAKYYQPPLHDTIVEPFAGAAGYACYWLQEDSSARAILYDSDPRIVDTWNRLLSSSPEDILNWSCPPDGSMSDDLLVVGMSGGGVLCTTSPNTVTARMVKDFASTHRRMARLRAIIGDRIEVIEGDYADAPDIEATWFIDPPYVDARLWYKHNSSDIDYRYLAEWSQSRQGQVIVCEAEPADWLPFTVRSSQKSLANTQGVELVWESDPTPTLFD